MEQRTDAVQRIHKRAARRARLEANAFEVLIAFLCLLSAISYFLEPDYLERSPIGQTVPAFQYAWVTMLLSSAGGILFGIIKGSARFEVGGLVMLAAIAGMQVVALVSHFWPAGLTSSALFLAVAWACLVRARLLWRYGISMVRENGKGHA